MKDTRHKETEFDELDATIAAALGDASAWPVPCAGFEERCVTRVKGILEEGEKRRPFWSFGGGGVPEGCGIHRRDAGGRFSRVKRSRQIQSAGARPERRGNRGVRGASRERHRRQVRTDGEDAGKGKVAEGGDGVPSERMHGGRYLM